MTADRAPVVATSAAVPGIVLVGNPNCGKTTLFNVLTGSRQQVGNWPGVTVERKSGIVLFAGGERREVVDLPGIYSLSVTAYASDDERVARDAINQQRPALIVNVVDAANLERNLYLTAQLLEMQAPMVVVLTMTDIARSRHIAIDLPALAQRLGCPVVSVVAPRRQGLEALQQAMASALANCELSPVAPVYALPVEDMLERIGERLPSPARWRALRLLEGDLLAQAQADDRTSRQVDQAVTRIRDVTGEEADILIADGRFAFVGAVMQACVRRPGVASRFLSDRIDRVVLNRILGVPLFLAVMYLMFWFTITAGGVFTDIFDGLAGLLLVELPREKLAAADFPLWLQTILADGIGGGLQTVAGFLPVVGFLFLFLSVLEDSGYMARAAFVMDRAMRGIGLPGKAFMPLLVGFGCNVPAILATRTLEHRRDRVMTAMMVPFMSCSARLPVYALFAAAFFPVGGQNVVFSLYLVGLGFAVATGVALKASLLKGEATPFVMELPPYHLPAIANVLRRTWDRVQDFLFRAGRVIVLMVLVLNLLDSVGSDGRFDHRGTPDSLLAQTGSAMVPLFAPMGLKEDNWPAAVGLFSGIFAKEAVVGTLNTLYASRMEPADQAPAIQNNGAGSAAEILSRLAAVLPGIDDVLEALRPGFADLLGISAISAEGAAGIAERLSVSEAVIPALAAGFDGPVGAYAYMLLILLYTPCVAATGIIAREIGWRWALFSAVWTTALSYGAAVVVYQAGTLERDPVTGLAWITACAGTITLGIAILRLAAQDADGPAVGGVASLGAHGRE